MSEASVSNLRFHPHMTLQAAARIAGQHGYELRVQWDGKQCRVITVKVIAPTDYVPMFLHPMQAGG